MTKTIAAAAGFLLVGGFTAAPALADYPPNTSGGSLPSNDQPAPPAATGSTTQAGPLAQTGSSLTTVGLLAGLAAIGAGTGVVVASRRRTN